MGKLVSEAAQNVYLGINKSKDEMVVDKMQKLEEQLKFFMTNIMVSCLPTNKRLI